MSTDECVLKTEDALVRIIEQKGNSKSPWHYHSEVTDDCFCLEGVIEVHVKNPKQTTSLKPGERCTIKVGEIHRVANCSDKIAKYLLIQGVGKYDFIESNNS